MTMTTTSPEHVHDECRSDSYLLEHKYFEQTSMYALNQIMVMDTSEQIDHGSVFCNECNI